MSVRLAIENHVATVTLSRPAAMNAVDSATRDELLAIWSSLETNADVRAIVLTGEGDRAFCAGADLKEPGRYGLDYWAHPTPGGFGGIALRETLNVPVIARVNGFALDGGAVLLQRHIPYRQAMGMLMTGRHITAQEALTMGLINEVVPRAELDEAVARWVKAILACAPTSLRAIKQCVRLTSTLTPLEAQRARLPALIEALEAEDAKEGVRAFREKRAPVWSGR